MKSVKKLTESKIKYKNYSLRLIPGLIIFVVILAFHIKLFFPYRAFYMTPDYGRSDTWHLSISNKFYYAQQLKENKIPIWNPHIGMGYPTLAEGQTAIFFLPNLILFRVIPFVWAYNVTLVFSFVLAGWGTYLFVRSIGLGKIAATYSGIIFPLGGFFVFHTQHHNLLQAASITPFLFWTTNEFIKKKSIGFLFLLSLLLAQQLFAGFPQIVAYSISFVLLYFAIHAWKFNKKKYYYSALFIASILVGFLLAAIQLVPTAEFLSNSDKITNPKQIIERFPYKIENLQQFVNPYILGSPSDGTYPPLVENNGIFWENSAYVGVLPLIMAIFAFIITKLPNEKKYILIFITLTLISLTLALGKASPLHPIYSFQPFSLFRIPSRFLLLTQFFVIIASSYFVNKLTFKYIAVFIATISILNQFVVLARYNPIVSANEWLSKPNVSNFLSQQNTQRIATVGQFSAWNQTFVKEGWKDLGFYFFSRNTLDPNSNLLFNHDQISAYESMTSKRYSALNGILSSGIILRGERVSVQSKLIPVLESMGVSHLIAPSSVEKLDLPNVFSVNYGNKTIDVYKLQGTSPIFDTYDKYIKLNLPSQISAKIEDPDFNIKETVVVEKDITAPNGLDKSNSKIEIATQKERFYEFKTNSQKPFLLMLKQSYFPGWESKINSTKTEVIPANLNFQAVIVPEGENQVSFEYKPKSLYLGTLITLVTSVCLAIFVLKSQYGLLKRFLNFLP